MEHKEDFCNIGEGSGECHYLSVYGKWIDDKTRQYYLINLEPSFRRADLTKSKYDFGIKRASLSIEIKNGKFIHSFPENIETVCSGIQEYKLIKSAESNGGVGYSCVKAGYKLSKSDEIITKAKINIYDTSCYVSGNTTQKIWTFEVKSCQAKPYLYGVRKIHLIVKVKNTKHFPRCSIKFNVSDIIVMKDNNVVNGLEIIMAKLLSPIKKTLYRPISFKLKDGLGWATKIIPSNHNETEKYLKIIKNPVPKEFPSLFPFPSEENKLKIKQREKQFRQVEKNINEAFRMGQLYL
jgi:hypothetical protein